MILSDTSILEAIDRKDIVIDPYDKSCLGTNSYDVHLSKFLACYLDDVIDAKKHNQVEHFEIPEDGLVLHPGKTYLGSTVEYTETRQFVPFLEGKSSVGRLGIDIHATAGRGMWDSVIIGLSKSRFVNRCGFMQVCLLAS